MSTLKVDVLKDVAETVSVNVTDISTGLAEIPVLRQDLANSTDMSKGAGQVARSVTVVTNLSDLAATPTNMAQEVSLALGGRSGLFFYQAGNLSAEVAADPLQGVYVAPDSDPSGATGAWVRKFNRIDGLNLGWFGAVADAGVTDNAVAIQAAYDMAAGSSGVRTINWDGDYGFATTITVGGSVITRGNPTEALGSTGNPPSVTRWTGGASPMFYTTGSRTRFVDLGVLNAGSATDWIHYGPGAILPIIDNIQFMLPSTTNRFSRSVLYSEGNRIGYGKMSRVNTGGSIAPKFIFVDGGADPLVNRVTTFSISDCVIAASSGLEMTLFYVRNQGIETLNIKNNSFNNNSTDSNLLLVDTTDTPATDVIFNLNFEGNEIDHIGTNPAYRKFKLTNVRGVNFNNNECSMGGQMTALGELVNSAVVTYEGNSIRSLAGPVWSADATSWVVTGANRWGVSGTVRPATNTVASATGRVTQSDTSVRTLDLSVVNSSGHTIREIDVNTASTFSIRAIVAEVTPGTVLTVVLRNVSGGAIATPSFFTTHFSLAGAAVAPASGFSRSYTFYHNGAKFVEVSRTAADVANV